MNYINYKNYKLSKLSLGTVQFGLDYGISNKNGKPKQNEVNRIVKKVLDCQVNFFDTAQAYGDSEKVLSKAIENNNDLYITSKISSDVFSRYEKEFVEKSLDNLNIEKLFALLLHDSKALFSWNEKDIDFLNSLKEKCIIEYFGVSIYTEEEFDIAIENEDIDIIQIPFNIFDQRAVIHGWFDKAKEKNKLIVIRSVFLQGLLLMNKNDIPSSLDEAKSYIEKFEKYCEIYNLTKTQMALSYVNSVAKESIILFGCDSVEQAEDNISTFKSAIDISKSDILKICDSFKNISPDIYNPSRW